MERGTLCPMKLIVGLGNPGKEYQHTRHNFGWDVVSMLASSLSASPFQTRPEFKASVTELKRGREKIVFALPLTFMNLSGDAVLAIKQFYKISEGDILIVHDELDFPLGRMAFALGGSAAGHNGIRSIYQRLGSQTIPRLRLGIGKPNEPTPTEVHVLQRFRAEERSVHERILHEAITAVETWMDEGLENAMNRWNRK